MFDKVLVLSDGNTIYHDSPQNVIPFFKKLGLEFGKYKNPAD
jgi:ABC-type multidrug transport system ATPase subunit